MTGQSSTKAFSTRNYRLQSGVVLPEVTMVMRRSARWRPTVAMPC